MEQIIFEKSVPGRGEKYLPQLDVPEEDYNISEKREVPPTLPQISELDCMRHYTRLSHLNYGVDTGFYPLGSCTMKYNPKINEEVANLPGFTDIHPYQGEETVQGALQLMSELQSYLKDIAGMDGVTLQPAAGAQGELTGLLLIKAYHQAKGEERRDKIIVPDTSHGTNPASAALCGLKIIQIPSDDKGTVDIEALKQAVGHDTAALMLTNPNTLGLFEENITEIADIVHDAGGLLYYDGANMNAIMGYARPGDMGFDVVHFNLHKTFAAPHGGGGPGAGPVGVKDFLSPFLPVPIIRFDSSKEKYYFDYNRPQSIGRVKAFYGQFSVLVKAYTYMVRMGWDGLKKASEIAVLNANYLMQLLSASYYQPFRGPCKHEFVLSPKNLKSLGIHTLDIAKRLMDYGFHPPTIYFPLIVEEAIMIEPTETESKETLDTFSEALKMIATEAQENPEVLKTAPHSTPVGRLDEVMAARKQILRWLTS